MLVIKFILDVRDKKKLTETLLAQLNPELGITYDIALNTWWHNLRAGSGLRLTKMGSEIFLKYLKLEHYKFDVEPFELNSRLMIAMDRKLQQPYYILTHKLMPVQVIFFGSKEAVMVNLYGDLQKFIDNYKI